MLGVMEERPPYVKFERRGVEKRNPGPPDGDAAIFYDEVDFALITPQGTKDCVERPVLEWFAYLKRMTADGRYNPEWLKAFQGGYNGWKEGMTIPTDGTAIANWPVASVSEVKRLGEINIRTVEDLAQANEEALGRMGMGARGLKRRAEDWITAQKGTAPLVTQLEAFRVTNAELVRQLEESKALNAKYAARLEVGSAVQPPQLSLQERLEAAQIPDDMDQLLK